jgi:benzoyl-CoA reductase/2-hydroxyglutaryl-CoA dehydratase subunit BcrC/BadD/HgdB
MDIQPIAYFDASHDMPEEIITAAGFSPYKILGDVHAPNDAADQYLPSFFCPAARSFLTEALSRSASWAGIIVAQGCNATNRHYDVWRLHVKTPFLHWFNAPLKDDALAAKFFRVELKRMIGALEKHYGVAITEEKLGEAIRRSNEIKWRLQQFAKLRAVRDIPNREYLNLLIKCLQTPKEDIISRLDIELARYEARPEFPAGKKRILLTGSDITYPEWMDTLDACGFRVVRDDLSLGERYFAHLIPEQGDPIDALGQYYLNLPKPATKVGMQKRIDYLVGALAETKIDAVVSQNLKFCEPYAFDAVLVNAALQEKGYRLIHLERDYAPVPGAQIVNRLTAFNEIL